MTRVAQNNIFDKFCSFKNFDRSNIYGARELFVFYCVGVEPWSNIHNAFVFVIQFLNPRDTKPRQNNIQSPDFNLVIYSRNNYFQ